MQLEVVDMLGFRVLLLETNLEPFQKCVLSSVIFFVFGFGIFFWKLQSGSGALFNHIRAR
jgi:hypothetical protein